MCVSYSYHHLIVVVWFSAPYRQKCLRLLFISIYYSLLNSDLISSGTWLSRILYLPLVVAVLDNDDDYDMTWVHHRLLQLPYTTLVLFNTPPFVQTYRCKYFLIIIIIAAPTWLHTHPPLVSWLIRLITIIFWWSSYNWSDVELLCVCPLTSTNHPPPPLWTWS